jgi:hypothetical protein
MSTDKQPLKVVVLTAALTAVVTTVMGSWVPSAAVKFVEWLRQEPVLIVEVTDNNRPVKNVKLSVSIGTSSALLASGETDETGSVKLHDVSPGTLVLEAVLEEGPYVRKYHKFHKVDSLPASLTLDKNKDFFLVTDSTAGQGTGPERPTPTPASSSPSPATQPLDRGLQVQYGKEMLQSDRKVQARLEIDRVEGTPLPGMQVGTSDGAVTVEGLFREVGIELEVVISDTLPASVLGTDGAFSVEELKDTMTRYRNASQPGKWNFYLIVAPRATTQAGSFMFDREGRSGCVILTEYARELAASDEKYSDPRFLTFEVIHELGHMLNLPHPWQAYGDTKSVMSYPFRWPGWSWDDPQVYRFDYFGRRHVSRAPDEYVMPGGSAFLDYGAPLPWLATAGSR